MRSVSQAVEEIIQRSPFYAEAMAEGIANLAQIARRIKPEVEKRLYEKVSDASIVMALHRMGKVLERPPFALKFLKQFRDITVRSSLVAFVCENTDSLSGALELISRSARGVRGEFLNFSRGLYESLIIVDVSYAEQVACALEEQRSLKRIEGLSAITMRLPESTLNVPGVYYPLLKALAMEGISFVEVMSVRTEFSIIFEDKDVDRAFSVLKRITS